MGCMWAPRGGIGGCNKWRCSRCCIEDTTRAMEKGWSSDGPELFEMGTGRCSKKWQKQGGAVSRGWCWRCLKHQYSQMWPTSRVAGQKESHLMKL